ncbi:MULTISPECIES: hypothetical protein [unclassified Crossiella]|uniref:hypothetical protein n=1 Tax=unclassified Crossiella TaxID=2620835 RepID=UPI001FFE709C|nr:MULTISPECIES: hypothetical protein [unclassified Crossiella]MCK2245232.1 hypothetical protein [Crossiella sp. S99.2]MCK2258846.1 hypothetical protein [Crossiella sp. S99.1]
MQHEPGEFFRQTWIDAVNEHYPGEPKSSYVAPWPETREWEQRCAAAVEGQLRDFLTRSDGHAAQLTQEQKGQYVTLCWLAQVYRHVDDPKPAYVAGWGDMQEWHRRVNISIFLRFEQEFQAS